METKEITKEWLQKEHACPSSLEHVCKNEYIGLGITNFIDKLIKNNRFNDAIWLITHYMNKEQNVKWTIFIAEQVLHTFEEKYPNDKRPREAIQAAKEYLKNPCEKTKTKAAADAAAYAAADAAADAAYDAAAYAAADAADLKIKIIEKGIKIIEKEVKYDEKQG